MILSSDCFFVFAGPPGSGKTTLLRELSKSLTVVPEYARRVLAEERQTGGTATGEQNPVSFVDRMLETAIADYDQAQGKTLFDRGLPDLLAFCAHYDIPDMHVVQAVEERRYNPRVFFLPAWHEIYETDAERRLDFAGARAFGARIREAYQVSGYENIEVPKAPIADRAAFVLAQLNR